MRIHDNTPVLFKGRMTIRNLFYLLFVLALLAGLASPIEAGETSSGPEDADLFKGISVDMRFYRNNHFGFGMAIPGDWHVAAGEEVHQLLEKCSRDNPFIKQLLASIASKHSAALLSISRHPPIVTPGNYNILILAHNISELPTVITGKDWLNYAELRSKQRGEKVIRGVHPVGLGGEEFYRLDHFSPRSGNLQSEIAKVVKGYVLLFILTACDQTQMNELDKIINSLDF